MIFAVKVSGDGSVGGWCGDCVGLCSAVGPGTPDTAVHTGGLWGVNGNRVLCAGEPIECGGGGV